MGVESQQHLFATVHDEIAAGPREVSQQCPRRLRWSRRFDCSLGVEFGNVGESKVHRDPKRPDWSCGIEVCFGVHDWGVGFLFVVAVVFLPRFPCKCPSPQIIVPFAGLGKLLALGP